MKPCACFIFFSWSVWLEAPSMHPAKSEDEDGKGRTPNRSGARDGMGSPASTTQTQAISSTWVWLRSSGLGGGAGGGRVLQEHWEDSYSQPFTPKVPFLTAA